MVFWNIFIYSIKLPNKKAMFQLNRMGLDLAIFYNFILLFLISIPTFIQQLNSNSFDSDMNIIFSLLYFFIFYYLPLTIIVLILLCVIASIGKIFATLVHRKLIYSLIWKMSAFTVTIPYLLYGIIQIFHPVSNWYLLVAFIFILLLLFTMILHYPKRRINK